MYKSNKVGTLHEENCKTLIKKNKWRDVPCSLIGRLNIFVSSSQIDLKSQCNSRQNLSKLFCGALQAIKLIHKGRRCRIASIILKNKVGGLPFLKGLLQTYSNPGGVVLAKE